LERALVTRISNQPIERVSNMLDKVFRKANLGSLEINEGAKLISKIEKRMSKTGDVNSLTI
jgi:type III secretory pathway lipoprotein EscJ